ncbi:MAG: hypothetical protein LQ345_005979 [Seirophora villosa]|nr:MAG: hypothetical protein LQ345_005979 [Seirophora villosa]
MPRPVTKASSVQSDAKRNHIADIAIVISSPSSPFRSPEERDPEHTSPVLNSTDSTAARSGSAQELAFFRGSFWARGLVMINFPRLPGFAVTEQWQYPASVYQVYDETESAHCENGVEITENDPKCACCSSSKCANRLIDGTGAVEARCVWLGGGVALRKFVKSDAFINSTGVDTLVTEYNVEDKTGLTRRKKKRRSRKNHTM